MVKKNNDKNTSLDELEDGLDAVLQIAQLLLRRIEVQHLLQMDASSEYVDFWRAFFQVILAHPFGIVTPGVSKWLKIAEQLDKYRLAEIKQDPLVVKRLSQYNSWNSRGTYSKYTVAQFWNANDIRAAAFVVSPDTSIPNRGIDKELPLQHSDLLKNRKDWQRRWELMDAINKVPVNDSPSGVPMQSTNIGNFVVQRSREMKKACLPFQLHVNQERKGSNFNRFLEAIKLHSERGLSIPQPEIEAEKGLNFFNIIAKTEEFRKINFDFLEVPFSIIKVISDLFNQFPRGQGNDVEDEAVFILNLANKKLWEADEMYSYLLYVYCFFKSNYYKRFDTEVSVLQSIPNAFQLRLILLNNLRIVHPLNGEETEIAPHYQYCIPVWNKSASYLFIVTRNALQKRELRSITKFAEQLFGLAWVYDSLRKLEQEKKAFVRQAERAARAAILARNFSHTVGSHVLSSPSFVKTLILGYNSTDFTTRLSNLERFIGNEVFNRSEIQPEELYNKLYTVKNVIGKFSSGQRTTQEFFKFLQGRFDFIARAIEDYRPSLEPVFFEKEFLNGFIAQDAFLDNLVKDLGWGVKDIEIQLFLPHPENEFAMVRFRSELVAKSNAVSLDWISESEISIDDCDILIGSPGGAIGAHAFYSILENLIRNSFKYGFGNRDEKDEDQFETYTLSIKLSKKKSNGIWHVYIWDNFSISGKSDDPGSTINIIINRLNKSIVDKDTGELIPEGLGLQEMKICAESLKPSSFNNSHEVSLGIINPLEIAKVCKEAFNPRRCESMQPLVYNLTLAEPILLAIYSKHSSSDNDKGWIRRVTTLSEIVDSGAHIVIIPGDLVNSRLLNEIGKIHSSLPYRMFVVCKSEKQKTKTEAQIFNSAIPKRRLHCYSDNQLKGANQKKSLYEYIKGPARSSIVGQKDTKSKRDLDKEWICHAYEAWLFAWKGMPYGGKWHLLIGFERRSDVIQTSWGKWLRVLTDTSKDSIDSEGLKKNSFNSDLISIVIRSREGSIKNTWISDSAKEFDWLLDQKSELDYWKKEKNAPRARKRALVFDNHGVCFDLKQVEVNPDYHRSTRFYQKTSGGESFALYQSLASPPAELFSFKFFVYSLVESCLCTVGVVDERVAAKVLLSDSSKSHFLKELAKFQKVGIFPLFLLRLTPSAEIAYYSPRHRVAVEKEIFQRGNKETLIQEGLQWNAEKCEFEIKVVAAQAYGRSLDTDNIHIDFLIIHEGVMDVLRSNYNLKWNSQMTEYLYDIVPSVIRTSGRGHHSPNIGSWIPFLEATELSASLITSLDKYKLSRALLGTSGDRIESTKLKTNK